MENAFEPGGWDDYGEIPTGWCTTSRRLVRADRTGLTASVYIVEPGDRQVPYHFHYGGEEILLVLEGAPTLRTPEGERTLAAGDIVHFPSGPDGAHQVRNDSDAPARVVVVMADTSPEVVAYPDSGKLLAVSRTAQLASLHSTGDTVGYWDGEVAPSRETR